jgi:hypothetical protein
MASSIVIFPFRCESSHVRYAGGAIHGPTHPACGNRRRVSVRLSTCAHMAESLTPRA